MNDPLANRLVDRATSGFVSLFGSPLDLWIIADGQTYHAIDLLESDPSTVLTDAALILPESLSTSLDHPEPAIQEVADGVFRIDAPLFVPDELPWKPGRVVVVAATTRTTLQGLTNALLRLGTDRVRMQQEIAEHRLGVDPHLEQISHDFEELDWLRRLNQQINISNPTDPLIGLAQTILPDLRALIQAEGLVLVGTSLEQGAAATGLPDVGQPVCWVGEHLLDDGACSALVKQLQGHMAPGRPLVLNGQNELTNAPVPAGIHSCVQVAVTHHGGCYGWLVALNRNIKHSSPDLPAQRQQYFLGHDEFGTAESTLMTAAACTLAAHARSAELFREREFLLIGIIRALISAIDAKDVYTCGHSDRVAVISRLIAEHLGMESVDCERVYMSGLLHDVGKIGIPDEVLRKPGTLTAEEFDIIKRHPSIGHAILSHLPQLRHVLPGVLHHHEAVDGRGYPSGLRGDGIPLFGRIIAVADAFDAMTSTRPYRPGMPVSKALSILNAGIGKQWDANVVQAFLDALPEIEAATQDSARHVQELLKKADVTTTNLWSGETDAITRAVTLSRA